jgi:hypothetical protein
MGAEYDPNSDGSPSITAPFILRGLMAVKRVSALDFYNLGLAEFE